MTGVQTCALPIWLLRFFLLAVVLQSPWVASSVFIVASNRHRRLARSYAISAGLTLVAIVLLIHRCGLLAVPLGAIIGESLACYHVVIKDACTVLKEEHARFAVRLWSAVVAISCAAWGAGYLGHSVAVGPAPLRWLQVGAMTTLAAALAAWPAIRKEDRSRLACWGRARWAGLRPAGAQLGA